MHIPTDGGLTQAGGKLSVQVESIKPLRSNTLVGFATSSSPRCTSRSSICQCTKRTNPDELACRQTRRSPAKAPCGAMSAAKFAYTPFLEFTNKATRDAFSARVIAALLEFAPDAFGEAAA